MQETVVCIGFDGKEYVTPKAELVQDSSIYGIVLYDNKVLLNKQTNGFDLPGGHTEEETDKQCVEREVKEETGLDVRAERQVGAQIERYFKHTQSDGRCEHSFMRYYLCKLIGGEISTAGFDEYEKVFAEAAEWLPIDELDNIKVGSSYDWRQLVRQAAASIN